jgi:ubiquinone/menaquinone biosynthesis C-methylase UbiE
MSKVETHKQFQWRMVSHWPLVDLVCRLRAAHVLRQTRISKHLPRAGMMLDVGAGYGHVAEAIMRDAPARSCVVLEPTHVLSLPVARRIARYACFPVLGDGRYLPFANATFDAAWALFVLHHVEVADQATILSEVARVLRPDGVFVLAEDTPRTPNEHANAVRADMRLNFESDGMPHNYRTPDEWRNELPAHGFAVVDEVAFRWLYPPATLLPVQHGVYICHRRGPP